jgi:hypothetical protein
MEILNPINMIKCVFRSLSIIAAVCLFFTACKKDKPVSITKESIAGIYKFEKVTFKANAGGAEEDMTDGFVDECNQDNLFKFEANGDFMYDDEGVQCNVDSDFWADWDLISTAVIEIDGENYDLVSFDGTTLVIGEDYDLGGGITGKLKTYIKRQ